MKAVQSKGKRIWSTIILLTAVGVLLLYNWVQEAVETAHVMPAVERCDIQELIAGLSLPEARGRSLPGEVSEETVQVLSEQTGLGSHTIREMFRRGREGELLEIQERYFEPVRTEAVNTTLFTISEWLVDEKGNSTEGMPLVDIQNGDILITKNSRFLGWRNGHAGLVVDAEKGLVLEALMLGTESCLCHIEKWESCPSFVVLRLKEGDDRKGSGNAKDIAVLPESVDGESAAVASKVAGYAKENLVDIPYVLWAGVFGDKSPAESPEKPEEASVLSGTQCAHLVWYAYMQAGIDLDSDGGIFVTPEDVRNSPYLEVVQKYGY